jgi:hypothetical protein
MYFVLQLYFNLQIFPILHFPLQLFESEILKRDVRAAELFCVVVKNVCVQKKCIALGTWKKFVND